MLILASLGNSISVKLIFEIKPKIESREQNLFFPNEEFSSVQVLFLLYHYCTGFALFLATYNLHFFCLLQHMQSNFYYFNVSCQFSHTFINVFVFFFSSLPQRTMVYFQFRDRNVQFANQTQHAQANLLRAIIRLLHSIHQLQSVLTPLQEEPF